MMQRIMGNLALSGLIVAVVGAACPEKHEEPKPAQVPALAVPSQPVSMAIQAGGDFAAFKHSVAEFEDSDAIHSLSLNGPVSDEELKVLSPAIKHHVIDLQDLTLDLSKASDNEVKAFLLAIVGDGFVGQLNVVNPMEFGKTAAYTEGLLGALKAFSVNKNYNGKNIAISFAASDDPRPARVLKDYFQPKTQELLPHEFSQTESAKGYVFSLNALPGAQQAEFDPSVLAISTDVRFHRGLKLIERSNPAIKTVVVGSVLDKEKTEALVKAFKQRKGAPLTLSMDFAGVDNCPQGIELFSGVCLFDPIIEGLAFGKIDNLTVRNSMLAYPKTYDAHLKGLLKPLSLKYPEMEFMLSNGASEKVFSFKYVPVVKHAEGESLTLDTAETADKHFSAELQELKTKAHLKELILTGRLTEKMGGELVSALKAMDRQEWIDLSVQRGDLKQLIEAMADMKVHTLHIEGRLSPDSGASLAPYFSPLVEYVYKNPKAKFVIMFGSDNGAEGHLREQLDPVACHVTRDANGQLMIEVGSSELAHLDDLGVLTIKNAAQFVGGMALLATDTRVRSVNIEEALTAEQYLKLDAALQKRAKEHPITLDINAAKLLAIGWDYGVIADAYLNQLVSNMPKYHVSELILRDAGNNDVYKKPLKTALERAGGSRQIKLISPNEEIQKWWAQFGAPCGYEFVEGVVTLSFPQTPVVK